MIPKDSGWIIGGDEPELPFSNASTSLEAAMSMQGGEGSTARGRVLAFIVSRGAHGATDDEVEIGIGMSHQTASARRRELDLRRLIVKDGTKRKTRSGRNAQVWIGVSI